MKKVYAAIIILSFTTYTINAATGCLDNSWHLKQSYDSKDYHLVSCSCPCESHTAKYRLFQARGQCPACKHYHDPRSFIIVTAQSLQQSGYIKPTERIINPKLRKIFSNYINQ